MRPVPLRVARNERIHPGPASLVFARVPICVKAAQQFAGGSIFHTIVSDGRIPDRYAGLFEDADAKQAAENLEHSRDHAIQLKVRAQLLFIKIKESPALLFGQVAYVPWLNRVISKRSRKLGQALVFLLKERRRFFAQVFEKGLCAFTVMRHAILEHEVGEIPISKKLGFFPPQSQDFLDESAVVIFTRSGSRIISPPQITPDCAVIKISHHGGIAGRLQSKSPAFPALFPGAFTSEYAR